MVVTNANDDTPAVSGIFEGLRFFLVQRLPSRSNYVTQIQSNGGRVVKTEDQADHIIADHFRKDCPPGSISYTFVENAIRNGELPSPNDHIAGPAPGTVRPAGSAIPGKSTRTPFTAEDDRVLWQWVERCRVKGGLIKGNEIYKQLEATNNRHTYQAWRDRYIKKLMDRPPPGTAVTVAANAPPSPPTAQDDQAEIMTNHNTRSQRPEQSRTSAEPVARSQRIDITATDEVSEPEQNEDHERANKQPAAESGEKLETFTNDDFEELLQLGTDIEKIHSDWEEDAWINWHNIRPDHSAQSWRTYYEEQVRPVYLQRRAERRTAKEAKRQARSESVVAEHGTQQHASQSESIDKNDRQRSIRIASPKVPDSTESQKRKRMEETPALQESDSHKKSKSGDTYDFGQTVVNENGRTKKSESKPRASGTLSTQPIELLSSDDEDDAQQTIPTSEPSQHATVGFHAEKPAEREEALPTSELDRQVQAQFLNEGLNRSDPQAPIHGVQVSNLPTSEANILADRQIQDELLTHEPENPGQGIRPPSTPELISTQAHDFFQSQLRDQIPNGSLAADGNPLTEANLASQQALHKEEVLRGTDLPEDNDARDSEIQNEYVDYLHDIMKSSGPPRSDPVSAYVDQSYPRDDLRSMHVEPPSQAMSLGIDDFELSPIRDLPISSQQEIDDAFDEAINWPDSPKASQRVVTEPQSLEFETQIPYPTLPTHQSGIGQQMEEYTLSQTLVSSQTRYPSLPEQERDGLGVRLHDSEQDLVDNERTRRSKSPLFERESSYAAVGEEEETPPSLDGQVEDDIDLSIPEPEDGWNEASSPRKADPSQVDRTDTHEQAGIGEDVEAEIVEKVTIQEEIVEVVSDSSSDSSEPASLEEAAVTDQKIRARAALQTQDIVSAETQQPDFEMPLPPDSAEESVDGKSSPVASSPAKHWSRAEDKLVLRGFRKGMTVKQVLDTYGIVRSPSALRNRRALLLRQFPKGEVPRMSELYDSEESDDEELPSDPLEQPSPSVEPPSSPPDAATLESQRKLPNIETLPEDDINSYIDKMVVFGYNEGSIISALKCTSMRPDLADFVLLEQKAGKGLPGDVAGVWSEAEDQTLEGGNARGLRKLEEKHTWKECADRMQFLRDWREEE